MSPGQLCNAALHNCLVRPKFGKALHVFQISRWKTFHLRKLCFQVCWQSFICSNMPPYQSGILLRPLLSTKLSFIVLNFLNLSVSATPYGFLLLLVSQPFCSSFVFYQHKFDAIEVFIRHFSLVIWPQIYGYCLRIKNKWWNICREHCVFNQ